MKAGTTFAEWKRDETSHVLEHKRHTYLLNCVRVFPASRGSMEEAHKEGLSFGPLNKIIFV